MDIRGEEGREMEELGASESKAKGMSIRMAVKVDVRCLTDSNEYRLSPNTIHRAV